MDGKSCTLSIPDEKNLVKSNFMNEFKQAVYHTAINQLKQKEALLSEERKNIIESILEEEKNSAGDKYETSRETMTQDLNSLEKQIKQSKLDLEELYRLQTIKDTPPTVQEGALVQLEKEWFLLAVSVGQVKVADKHVFLLSKNSPLGDLLVGRKKLESIQFRGKTQTISELI